MYTDKSLYKDFCEYMFKSKGENLKWKIMNKKY